MGLEMTNSPTTWRFIDSGPCDGPTNMALDEALLASFDPASSSPVLRLYGWHPPAFSLGKFQDAGRTLDLQRCRAAGIEVVRRVTAGGIIYHADEVTYSIVCAQRHIPGARSIKESFKKICGFLLLAYRKLGLDAGFAIDRTLPGAKLGERTALCFAGQEEYDILIEGRKLGGNAQRRLKDVVFQHGSIPLRNCLPEALGFLREDERPAAQGLRATSLAELGVRSPAGDIKKLLHESFAENLAVSLLRSEPETKERQAAAQLLENKYSLDRWNRHGKLE